MAELEELRSPRPLLSPAARALRIQRIFARLQEGASYRDIAAEEGVSRERLRQIVRAATARGKSPPDHKTMQFARLEPALRLAARGVAEGDVKAIPLLIKLVDRLATAIAIQAPSTSRLCSASWRRGRSAGGLAAARRRRSIAASTDRTGRRRERRRPGAEGADGRWKNHKRTNVPLALTR